MHVCTHRCLALDNNIHVVYAADTVAPDVLKRVFFRWSFKNKIHSKLSITLQLPINIFSSFKKYLRPSELTVDVRRT